MGGASAGGGTPGTGFWQNPLFQMGMGLLAGNQGITGDAAFRNALGSGMGMMNRSQLNVANIQRLEQERKWREMQMAEAQRKMEQQRQMRHMAPQLAKGLLSEDPTTQNDAVMGLLGMQPDQMMPLLLAQMKAQEGMAKPTSLMQNLEAAGLMRGTDEYQQAMMDAITKPAASVTVNQPKLQPGFMPIDPSDLAKGVRPIPGGSTDPASKPLTQSQELSFGYAQRMISAEQELDKVFGQYSPTAIKGLQAGGVIGAGAAAVASEQSKMAKTAQEDWIRAKLRRESGATILPQEMEDERKVYFPQPLDGAETIMLKRRLRQTAIEAMAAQAGYGGKELKIPELAIPSLKSTDEVPKQYNRSGQIIYVEDLGKFKRIP